MLRYGIPSFRLPREIIDREVRQLRALGVKIETNKVVGKTFTIDAAELPMGFYAVFVAAGAGAPVLPRASPASSPAVYSANEFLTRVNLMGGYRFPYRAPPSASAAAWP